MTRKLLPLALLVAVLAVSPAYGRVADHNPIEATDPAGDSNGAPDITRVTVANSLDGFLLFVIQVGNREGIAANDRVTILIDADLNGQTGAPLGAGGVDYLIGINGTAQKIFVRRWNGTVFEDAAPPSLRGAWGPGYVAGISRADLGNTSAFDFVVLTGLETGADDQIDVAPTDVYLRYAIGPPHVTSIAPRFSPVTPTAGRTFRLNSVQLTFETEETAAAASFSCRATLAGKRLRGTGQGGCTFKLPKTAKRKQFVVTVTATPAGGKAQTFPAYKFRVR